MARVRENPRRAGWKSNILKPERETREEPLAVPERHRRPLTPPPSSSTITPFLNRQQRHDQSQCYLLSKLPVEVRLMIWKSAIGGQKLRIHSSERGWFYIICK